jgi:hypothetical protein
MEKYLYIKQSIAKHFIDFAEPLSAEEYNNLGETWQDYVDNKWVLLNEEQRAFYIEHPNATPKEVWDIEMFPEPERTIEQAKREKIEEIEIYDQSEAVNSFTIGNLSMWLTVDERQQIATQINANESIGRQTMTKWFQGNEFTFPVSTWRQMLIALEVYAGDALNVTEAHKAAVNALDNVEDVDGYNYATGYPEKLHFNIE